MSGRLVTLVQAARYLQVSDRTVSAYIGKGLFPAYRIPGKRSHYVDLNEVDSALAVTSRTVARPKSTQKFGPLATIIDLPPQPTRVEAVEGQR